MERFPNHPNTKTLESLSKSSNPIAAKLSVSVSQMGKSSEWITVDTRCFYNSAVEAEQKANYDRTRTGMEKRFSCLRSHVELNGFKNFPSNQEIDAFIQNVENLPSPATPLSQQEQTQKRFLHFRYSDLVSPN